MLQKWLDVNPVTKLTRTSTYITLPAFVQGSNTWNGYSDIVESFNFEGPNNMSLTGITGAVPTNPNYTLCVSYQINGVVTRYLIWLANGSNMNQNLAQYTNQRLLKNFRLEIWNTNQGIASQSGSINFYTSVLGLYDYRWATDGVLVNPDSPSTNFNANSFSAYAADPPLTNLVGWFNADDLAAGTVATWKSKTVQGVLGHDVLNAYGTQPVTCIANDPDFNGHNSVQNGPLAGQGGLGSPYPFDPASLLFNSQFGDGSIAFVVLKCTSTQVGDFMFEIVQPLGGGGFQGGFQICVGPTIGSIEVGDPTNGMYGPSSIPAQLGQTCMGVEFDNGLVGAYSIQNQTWYDQYYPYPQYFQMSQVTLGGVAWKCAEILIYTSLATPADAQQLFNYLTTRYGTSTTLFKLPLNFLANAISKTN
jgi:hypothetical protein